MFTYLPLIPNKNSKHILEQHKKSIQLISLTSMAALLTACDFTGLNVANFAASTGGTNTIVDANYKLFAGLDTSETVDGTSGADLFTSSLGADVLNGKDGIDKVDYSLSPSGVSVYLDGSVATGGHAAFDKTINIENLDGSEFSDNLHGNALANIINGLGGNDLITSDAGADIIDGGADKDTMSYAYSTSGVTAYLDGTAGVGGFAEGDTLTNIEVLIGSAFNDKLHGDQRENSFYGLDGNDEFFGSLNADNINGGDGTDLMNYTSSDAGVEAYLNGTKGVGGDAEGDVIAEVENLTGSKFNDILTGNGDINVIIGLEGDDQIFGGGNNDILWGGVGSDSYDGGDGDGDLVDYSLSPEAVVVHLDGSLLSGGFAAGDKITLVENLNGSAFDDHLYGDENANTLYGLAGNDQLTGNEGDDVLAGNDGDDSLDGSGGDDMLYGGAGDDNLVGGFGDDGLAGGAGADKLTGGAGADSVIGGAGVDIYYTSYSALNFVIDKVENKISISTNDGGINSVDELVSVETIASLDIAVADVDVKDIWGDLAAEQQALFTDENDFQTWLGTDDGYNYEGL